MEEVKKKPSDVSTSASSKHDKKEAIQGGKILGLFPEESVPDWAMGLMATFFMFIVGFIMLVQFGGFQPMQTAWMDGYSKMQEAQVYKAKEMTKIDVEERKAEIEVMKRGGQTNTRAFRELQGVVKGIAVQVRDLNATLIENNGVLHRHNARLNKLEG